MNRMFHTLCVYILIVYIAAGCDRSPKLDSPLVWIDHPNVDLGRIGVSEDATTVAIPIRNIGTRELRIRKVITSCNCTKVGIDSDVIPPGETVKLEISFIPRVPEKRRATATVHTNDPRYPSLTVALNWEAQAPIRVEPNALNLGRVTLNSVADSTIELLRDKKLARAVDCDVERVELRHSEEAPNASVRLSHDRDRILVNIPVTGSPGNGHLVVAVLLRNSFPSEILIPIRWQAVYHRFEISPERVFLGVGYGGEPLNARLLIHADADTQLEFNCHAETSTNLRVRTEIVTSTSNSGSIEISAILPAYGDVQETNGLITGAVVLTMNKPQAQTIHVPFSAVVRKDQL